MFFYHYIIDIAFTKFFHHDVVVFCKVTHVVAIVLYMLVYVVVFLHQPLSDTAKANFTNLIIFANVRLTVATLYVIKCILTELKLHNVHVREFPMIVNAFDVIIFVVITK